MFSKDASFQIALDSAPEELRAAFKDRSLDQPGVLVAYIEDVLSEGLALVLGQRLQRYLVRVLQFYIFDVLLLCWFRCLPRPKDLDEKVAE